MSNETSGEGSQPPNEIPASPAQPAGSSSLLRQLPSIKVRYKIAGTFIVLLCLTVLSLGIVTFNSQKQLLLRETEARAAVLAQQLANSGKEALLTKQELPIAAAIADVVKREDVIYAMVIDSNGVVFAHNDYALKGSKLSGAVDKAAMEAEGMLFQETEVQDDAILDAAAPIQLQSKKLKIGHARIGLSQKALKAAIEKQKKTYLLISLGFVLAGLAISFVLSRILTKPLDRLSEGIRKVSEGDLRNLVPVTSNDEFGTVTRTFNEMVLSLREKLHMEKYLSQSAVNSIRQHRDQSRLKLGGERKYVTALFSDVRGFTSLSEKMTPEEVVSLMNTYLNFQAEAIMAWGGSVDKFVGDEVMAVFEGRGNEIKAVSAAMEIQHYCATLNRARAADGLQPVAIGIGINSGDVVMGNMGSEQHMDYTVIGDNVNVAARLCGIANPGQVLISKAVAEAVHGEASCQPLPPVTVKGKDKPLEIFAVESVKGGRRHYKRKEIEAALSFVLAETTGDAMQGALKNLSPMGCLFSTANHVSPGSKLTLSFDLAPLGKIESGAIVQHVRDAQGQFLIAVRFEDLEYRTQARIVQWVHRVNT